MFAFKKLENALPLIENKICYQFKDKQLLMRAFVHSSFVNEHQNIRAKDNERLEFLGDAVLALLVSLFLYQKFPNHSEGELSYLRSRIVEAATCALYIEKMGLESFILMGRGESMSRGKRRNTISADLFEAIIGAIYLDGGIEKAERFFFTHFESIVLEILKNPMRNWKADLQEYCQKNHKIPPTYEIVDEKGPDHNKTFYVVVRLDSQILGKGMGPSKKEAEQMGAEQAMRVLEVK